MKLTTFTDYSLRVLIYVAVHPRGRATIAGAADALGVSENHLVKVVHFLGKTGWLANLRGKGGGIELAMAPAQIRLGGVIRAAEGEAQLAECFREDGHACVIGPACRVRGVLVEALQAFFVVLDRYTLADMVNEEPQLVPLLFTPRVPQ